jgi:hypothetical protein
MNELFAPTYKKNSGLIRVAHTNWGDRFGGRGFTANPHHRYEFGRGQSHDLVFRSEDPHLDTPADILELFKHVDNVDGVTHSLYKIADGTHRFHAYIDTARADEEGMALESIEQSLGLFVISRFSDASGLYITTENTVSRTILASPIRLAA